MCANCDRLTRRVETLRRLLGVFRSWFARRQCQLRPSGILQAGAIRVDTDQCWQCEVGELVRRLDEAVKENRIAENKQPLQAQGL